MTTTLPFDNIAVAAATRFKKKFPKLDYDDLLQEARVVIFNAKLDESKSEGEQAKYLKTLVEWRLKDSLRISERLRYKKSNRIHFVCLEESNSNKEEYCCIDRTDYKEYLSSERRKNFLEEVRGTVEETLSPEQKKLYRLVFVEGKTEREVSKQTGVTLRIVCAKRQELVDSLRIALKGVRV